MGGNNHSILYAEPITNKPEGESPVYRHPNFKKGLIDGPFEGVKTIKQVLINSMKEHATRNALGTIVRDGDKVVIKQKTYA